MPEGLAAQIPAPAAPVGEVPASPLSPPLSKKEAAVKSLAMKALKGDPNALKSVITLIGDEADADQPTNEQPLSAADEAQLRRLLGDEAVDRQIGAEKGSR